MSPPVLKISGSSRRDGTATTLTASGAPALGDEKSSESEDWKKASKILLDTWRIVSTYLAMALQFEFFDAPDINREALDRLQGLRYRPNLITQAQEQAIAADIGDLPFAEFDFHGYKGKRRVVSFGWRYEFAGGGQLQKAEDIPEFLLPLRFHAASFAEREPDYFQHVLVTEYGPGAGVGWHRDKAVFGEVVGISLLSPCLLRFRRKTRSAAQAKKRHIWERANLFAEPRSAYLLTGPSRSEWEHSILKVDALRYSITFRHVL